MQTKEQRKIWVNKNRDKVRAISRRSYQKHRSKRIAWLTAYGKTIRGHLNHCVAQAKQRCTNTKNPRYSNYGGRGIKLCFTSQELYNWCTKNKLDSRGLDMHRKNGYKDYTLNNIEFLPRNEHSSRKKCKG